MKKANGKMTQDIIKIRLNMEELKSNYKNKKGADLSCPLYEAEEDTTEQVLRCTKVQRHQGTERDFYCSDNVNRLARLVELFQVNERLRNSNSQVKGGDRSM